jgi:hypothetical protein
MKRYGRVAATSDLGFDWLLRSAGAPIVGGHHDMMDAIFDDDDDDVYLLDIFHMNHVSLMQPGCCQDKQKRG